MARPRILVVDDDAAHRRAVERVLEASNDLEAVAGAAGALAACERERFDLAILDIRMPGMDGFTLMGELKTADPDLDVILMTGSASDIDARLARAVRERAFYFIQKPFHRDVLLALVARCLEIRRLNRERAAHASRLAAELEAARRFQASMLPAATLERDRYELAALYEPSLELGGDFFDYAELGGSVLALLVSDVAGKGAAAAMLTGMVKQAFHAAAPDRYAPATAMQRVFEAVKLFPDDRFLTAFCARIDAQAGLIEYICTAGHPPPLLKRRSGELEPLVVSSDVLHPAFDMIHFEQKILEVQAGDVLMAFTDGLMEARRSETEEWYDFEGIERSFAKLPIERAPQVVTHLREALREFQAGRPPEDDLTIVAVGLK
ncbi:MAG: SpoIIE family protein phosphatase [Candidatus Eisenbacteria bacterium]|uniref:SpoIIE family protein phosphatase n=1 Tax=Eiseniibacteriota bacterium TaxID=2212470 RepID=A0A849SEE7_UNCEI|nr:SpoIIE family protein phosphatase [Candidatus Eisenbacteria bacterium]